MDRRTEIRAFGDELRDEFRLAVAGLRDGSLPQRLDELSDAVDAAAAAGSGGMEADSTPEAPEGDPPAFSVRWDPTLADGAGGWAVYLPTEHLLSYDGAGVATSDISGLTVVQDAGGNDTPWYSLDEVGADAEHVWLVLTVPGSGPVEAEFAEEEGQAASGEEVVNVCVAEIDRSMSDAAGNPVPVVRQSLVGALHLGSTDKPLPYEVRWDDSLDGGSGGYKIYLPATMGLLSFWGDEVATWTFTGVTSLGASARWFSLDNVSASAQNVWLVITAGFSNGAFSGVSSAGFSDTQGTASTGTVVRNVRVAELSSAGHAVRQALVGALHIGHKLVAGDDTNLKFAPAANGEDIKVDVYYA